MNKRIKQLVDQCWEEDGIGPADFNPEKFAELIINESIEVMIKHDYHGEWLGQKLKQHFGVEE